MKPLLDRLFDKWKAGEVAPRPRADPQAILAFETRYNLRLPTDFREYLTTCDGMNDGEMDDDLFSFWELSRIRPVPDELAEDIYREYREFPGASSFFCFADWSINADVFSIELHADPAWPNRIAALGPRYLSLSSFSEFVEVYLSDFRALLA
jgi:hypothetical protein